MCAYNLRPFLTETSENIFKQLNIKDDTNEFNKSNVYKDMKPEVLFARIDKEKKLKEIEGNL